MREVVGEKGRREVVYDGVIIQDFSLQTAVPLTHDAHSNHGSFVHKAEFGLKHEGVALVHGDVGSTKVYCLCSTKVTCCKSLGHSVAR